MKTLLSIPFTLLAIVGVLLTLLGQVFMFPLAGITGRYFHCSWGDK